MAELSRTVQRQVWGRGVEREAGQTQDSSEQEA